MDGPGRGLKRRDVMVLIAVVGVACGLAIGLRNRTARSYNRISCVANMRQVGLGLIGHMNARNRFPNAGTFGERPEAMPGQGRDGYDARESTIYRMLKDPQQFRAKQGTPASGEPTVGPLHSWVVDVLPFIDNQELYDTWDWTKPYSAKWSKAKELSNAQVASVDIGVLRCPDDNTTIPGKGNLSYVVNGGFSRWVGHATWNPRTGRFEGVPPPGLTGTANGVPTGYGKPLDWGSDTARRTGVMFLGTAQGNTPWDVHTGPSDLVDGASTTVLLSESLSAGYARPGTNSYAGGAEVNWAAPLPNSVMFFGSDDVCGGPGHAFPGSGRCIEDRGLGPVSKGGATSIGPSWRDANRPGSPESINAARSLPVEGGFPYPSSNHTGGVNVGFCDGSARFVSETIDGGVWAQLLTPAGSTLPLDPPNGKGSLRHPVLPRSYDE